MNFLPFKKLAYLRVWLIPMITYLALVAVLCLIRLEGPPSTIPYLDKIEHMIAYTLMGFAAAQLFQKNEFSRAALLCFTFSFVIECLQGLTSYRSFELADLAVNLTGAYTGASFTRFIMPNFLVAIDSRLQQNLAAKSE